MFERLVFQKLIKETGKCNRCDLHAANVNKKGCEHCRDVSEKNLDEFIEGYRSQWKKSQILGIIFFIVFLALSLIFFLFFE